MKSTLFCVSVYSRVCVSLQIRVVKLCNFHMHIVHDLQHLFIVILVLAFEKCVYMCVCARMRVHVHVDYKCYLF